MTHHHSDNNNSSCLQPSFQVTDTVLSISYVLIHLLFITKLLCLYLLESYPPQGCWNRHQNVKDLPRIIQVVSGRIQAVNLQGLGLKSLHYSVSWDMISSLKQVTGRWTHKQIISVWWRQRWWVHAGCLGSPRDKVSLEEVDSDQTLEEWVGMT